MRKSFNELCIEVTKNREELKAQRELIDFLLEHDRNDVVFCHGASHIYGYREFGVKYIYNRKIECVKICGCVWGRDDGEVGIVIGEPNIQELIENTEEKFVVKVSNKYNLFTPRYYRVEKHNSQVADVTEYYQQEEPTTVANPDTPAETDFKYFTAEQVRNMSMEEVRENFTAIMKSMKKWG